MFVLKLSGIQKTLCSIPESTNTNIKTSFRLQSNKQIQKGFGYTNTNQTQIW